MISRYSTKAFIAAAVAVAVCQAAGAVTFLLHPQAAPKPNVYMGSVVDQNQIPASVFQKYAAITHADLQKAQAPGVISPQMKAFVEAQRNKASQEVSVEKREALSQLGVPSLGTGTLYILVSSSMPKSMLRQYAAEAIYTGAILDFRGVLADKPYPLTWFLKHEILPILSLNKNARPTVTIDPRPYEIWNVHAVPAIIYTQVHNSRLCPKQVLKTTRSVNYKGHKVAVPYHACAPMGPKQYWEVRGAVTLKYALRRFIAHGAVSARPLLRALDKGVFPKGGTVAGIKASTYAKMQTPGGIDTILDALKSEGYYAANVQAFNYTNPGDFMRESSRSVRKALAMSEAGHGNP